MFQACKSQNDHRAPLTWDDCIHKKKSNFPGLSIFLLPGLTQIKFATKSFPSQMAIRGCPHTIVTPSWAHIPTSSFSFPVSTTLSSFFIFSYASFYFGKTLFSTIKCERSHNGDNGWVWEASAAALQHSSATFYYSNNNEKNGERVRKVSRQDIWCPAPSALLQPYTQKLIPINEK